MADAILDVCRGKKVPQPGEIDKILSGHRKIGLDALITVEGDV